MTHTALLIHSLTQAHARPREDREARHRQSEPTSEREREQHTTQHNDEYIVNTLTMYSIVVWYGRVWGRDVLWVGTEQADSPTVRVKNALPTGRVHREPRTPFLLQVFYFSFGFNTVNGPSRPRISPHTITKQYSGADAE